MIPLMLYIKCLWTMHCFIHKFTFHIVFNVWLQLLNVHALIRSHSFLESLIESFIQSRIQSLIQSFIQPLAHSLTLLTAAHFFDWFWGGDWWLCCFVCLFMSSKNWWMMSWVFFIFFSSRLKAICCLSEELVFCDLFRDVNVRLGSVSLFQILFGFVN